MAKQWEERKAQTLSSSCGFLDGAKDGEPVNLPVITNASVGIPAQVAVDCAGSQPSVTAGIGGAKCNLGTIAVENP
jgi:hypothetical protein